MPSRFGRCSSRRKPFHLVVVLLMASLLPILLLFHLFLVHPSSSSLHNHRKSDVTSTIVQACKATRFPDTCQSSLSGMGVSGDAAAMDIIQEAVKVSRMNLSIAQGMVKAILESSSGNINRTNAAENSIELLNGSSHRAQSTAEYALPSNRNKDALAWMSAALLFQYDSWNAFKYANDTSQTDEVMSYIASLMILTSNALSMIHSLDSYGSDISLWLPPKTERDGYWPAAGTESPSSERGGVSPPNLTPDVTVCKGNCNYNTVQAAVNAAPENSKGKRFVIYIKEGLYDETVRVPLSKKYVVFLGDGMGKTVITGSLTAGQPGISTYNTATVGVLGDYFMAKDLTIQNTAGAPTHQAVAFRSESDQSIIENCEFLGNQDTLYAHGLRQYFRSCRIVGNVDFIFGNSAAVFENCLILTKPRLLNPEKGAKNAITAHGRTDPAQSTGFVFHNCTITGTDEYITLFNENPTVHLCFMGRPWKEYSRTVYIGCNLGSVVTAAGWLPWSGEDHLKTLYYGEFKNTGAGSDTSKRVSWSNQIPSEHVHVYSLDNFIQGSSWIPKAY